LPVLPFFALPCLNSVGEDDKAADIHTVADLFVSFSTDVLHKGWQSDQGVKAGQAGGERCLN